MYSGHPLGLFPTHPNPAVCHFQAQIPFAHPDPQFHAPLLRELDRVPHQVGKNLLQSRGIRHDRFGYRTKCLQFQLQSLVKSL